MLIALVPLGESFISINHVLLRVTFEQDDRQACIVLSVQEYEARHKEGRYTGITPSHAGGIIDDLCSKIQDALSHKKLL